MTKKMILDLDTGIDDALAIAYALGSSEVELIGITSTYGNVLMEDSAKNSLAILDLLGHSEVPVFLGEPHSITTDDFSVTPISCLIHGFDGVGLSKIEPSKRVSEKMNAVDFIIEATHKYGKDLLYVPTGPLTNLSAAIKKDPSIVKEVGRVVNMGGALCASGNVNPWAEANISQDPEACDHVFRSGIPVTMIGLDVTLQTLLTRRETAMWRDIGTLSSVFYANMTDYYIAAYDFCSPHLNGCSLHDPLAVAVAVDPTLVKCLPINMKCDVEGPTRGRTIGDNERINDPIKTMEVALQVDVERFLNEFMDRITTLLKNN